MDVTFVLRNILEIPEVQLEAYLKHLGDPLEGWSVELCGTCEETVAKAKQIHEEMMEAQRRFKEVKFEVISKIMSIQQGIKCGDKKDPEAGTESLDCGGGTGLEDNLKKAGGSVNELTGHQIEEMGTETGQADFGKTEEPHPSSSSDNENLLEFHYHIKTEEQLSNPEDVDVVNTPDNNSGAFDNGLEPPILTEPNPEKASNKKRSRVSKSRHLAIPKAQHGLVMKGRKHLPKTKEGPVQCKCGNQYCNYDVLLRHVKETLQGPEDSLRCEICLRQQPSKLTIFKQKCHLTRHVQFIHEGKRILCPRCEKGFHADSIKRHLKICRRMK